MIPISGQAFDLYLVCESIATPGTFYAHASAPTCHVSSDGAAWTTGDLTVTLPHGASTPLVKVAIAANAMIAANVAIKCEDGTGTNWRDVMIVLNTDAGLNLTASQITLDVWDTDISAFATAGSGGKKLNDLPLEADLVDSIWREDLTAHEGVLDSGAMLLKYLEGEAAAMASRIWDALLTSHNVVNTFGAVMNETGAGGDLTATQVAQAVWNALLANYTLTDSFGEHVGGLAGGGGGGLTAQQTADAVWGATMSQYVAINTAAEMLRSRGHYPDVSGEVYWPESIVISTGTLGINDEYSLQYPNEPMGVLPDAGNIDVDTTHTINSDLTNLHAEASIFIPSPDAGTIQFQVYNHVTPGWDDLMPGRFFSSGHQYETLSSWALTSEHVNSGQVNIRLAGTGFSGAEIYIDWVALTGQKAAFDADAIASAVWSEALPGAFLAGEAGNTLHQIYLTCQTIDTSGIALNSTIENVPMELVQSSTNQIILSDVPYPSSYDGIVFTAKYDPTTPDDMAIIQVALFPNDASKSGLIIIGGHAAPDSALAYLVPNEADKELTVYISSVAAAELMTGADYYWDVKAILTPSDALVMAHSNQLTISDTATSRTS